MSPIENPCQAPGERGAVEAPGKTPRWWLRVCSCYLCVCLSLLSIAGYAFTAWMLLPQAVRLEAGMQKYPPPFRDQEAAWIQASWTLGSACIVLAVTTLIAAVLAVKQRCLAAWSLLLLGFVAYVVLAMVVNPT